MGLLVEKLLSSREADQKLEVPDEASTLLRKEMADLKKENGKLKEEQLRAAAAAEAAETARLAQLAAQSQANAAQTEKLEQALEELRARLEQKSAQIQRLEGAREVAVQGYWAPKKFSLDEYLESKSEPEAGEEEYNFEDEFEDECEAEAGDWLQRATKTKKGQSKQKVKLHKKQGATPPWRQSPVSGGSRSRDQVEPTGETPTQPKTRSKSEEK